MAMEQRRHDISDRAWEKIRQWEKRSSFYADVFQVTKKLNQLEAVSE